MSKKKTKAPQYAVWQGNDYTKRADQNVNTYGDWISNNWENAVTAPTIESYYDYVKQVNEPAMNDFLEGYNTKTNEIASRNYNRFGGLTSTPALYTQDMLNKQMNDKAVRQASQMLSDAYSMKNQDWANQLNALGTVYGMYNDAGNTSTSSLQQTYNDLNRNVEAQYVADKQNQGGGWSWGNMVSGAMSGAGTGASVGGPWGAVIGGVAGGALGGLSGYTGASGDQASQMGSTMGNLGGNASNWLKTKGQGFTWTK